MDFRRSTDANPEQNCEFENKKRLRWHAREMKVPIIKFCATHDGADEAEAAALGEEHFGNLAATLEVAKGARMLLTKNLSTSRGLINGTRLEVVDVLYAHNCHPNHPILEHQVPLCIVCNVPHYTGPPYFKVAEHPKRAKWLPFLTTAVADENNKAVRRKQFPLTLSWALTPQKAQGMTLDKAVVNCSKVATPGVLFVSLSRVRHYKDLLLEDSFPALHDIQKLKHHENYKRRRDWERQMLERFSDTVRRNMTDSTVYSEENCWTVKENEVATLVLKWWKEQSDDITFGVEALKAAGFLHTHTLQYEEVERVCFKLQRYPHFHLLDKTAEETLRAGPRVLDRSNCTMYQGWRMMLDDLQDASVGDLSPAVLRWFCDSAAPSLPASVFFASPFDCNKDKVLRDLRSQKHGILCYPFRSVQSKI